MNKECPKCREIGRDKDGDHLFLMSDGKTWHCNKPYHEPYFEYEDGPKETKREVSKLDHLNVIGRIKKYKPLGFPDRKISKDTHKHFRVRVEVDQSSGLPAKIFYPETVNGKHSGYKERSLPKSFRTWVNPKFKDRPPDFFGQHCCPKSGRKLLITGGEEDAMAFYEAMKERYPDQTPYVVSLPRGEETSEATVAANLEFLSGFEEIIIGTDMDEAGRNAIKKLIPIIGPDRARVLSISEKDASDMWLKGKKKELINAYYQAKEYRPSNIVSVEDILEESIQPVSWGLSYPWEKLTRMTYGLKDYGEIIGLGAAPGKTLPL